MKCVLGAAVLIAACSGDRGERVSTTATRGLATAEHCPAPPEDPDKPGSKHLAGPSPHLGRDPLDLGPKDLIRFALDGCLNAAATAAEGERFPSLPIAPRDADQRLRINQIGDQWIITHEVAHPCCLRGRVEGRIDGGLLRIDEHLTGEPCRCECSSTIRTAFRLGERVQALEVHLNDRGHDSVLYKATAATLRTLSAD